MNRYITTWRKPAPNVLDWDHHVSENIKDAQRVVENLLNQGVHQYHTFVIGEQMTSLSSPY